MIDRPTTEWTEGPTPCGGSYAVTSYFDDRGRPCGKDDALVAVIVEFGRDGREVHRTRMECMAGAKR